MNKQTNPVELAKQKNKPNLVGPIFNTILACIMLIIIVVFYINKDITTTTFSIGSIVALGLIFISWYNGVFSKKKNLNKIEMYEKETEEMIKMLSKTKHHYRVVTKLNSEIKFDIFEKLDNIPDATLNKDTFIVNETAEEYPLIVLGLTVFGLTLNKDTLQVNGVYGMLPYLTGKNKKIKLPLDAAPAKLKVIDFKNKLNKNTLVMHLCDAQSYLDKKQNIICIGDYKYYDYDDKYEIAKNVFVILRDNVLISLIYKYE